MTKSPTNTPVTKANSLSLGEQRQLLDELYGDGTRHSWQESVKILTELLIRSLSSRNWGTLSGLWAALLDEVYGSKEVVRLGFADKCTKGTLPLTTVKFARKLKLILLCGTLPPNDHFLDGVEEEIRKKTKEDFNLLDFLSSAVEMVQNKHNGDDMNLKPREKALLRDLRKMVDILPQDKIVLEKKGGRRYVLLGRSGKVNEFVYSSGEYHGFVRAKTLAGFAQAVGKSRKLLAGQKFVLIEGRGYGLKVYVSVTKSWDQEGLLTKDEIQEKPVTREEPKAETTLVSASQQGSVDLPSVPVGTLYSKEHIPYLKGMIQRLKTQALKAEGLDEAKLREEVEIAMSMLSEATEKLKQVRQSRDVQTNLEIYQLILNAVEAM